MFVVYLNRADKSHVHVKGGHKNEDGSFHQTMGRDNVPIRNLFAFALAFTGYTETVQVFSDDKEIQERFLQLLQRSQTSEHISGGQPLINYVTNLSVRDRYDFDKSKGCAKGKTVIFCGAGPSLEKHFDEIVNSGHFVIAGGSAMAVFARKGVKPDAVMAVDPNEAQLPRFREIPKDWTDVPLIYKNRLNIQALQMWPGRKLCMPGGGTKELARWEGKTSLPSGGVSVTTTSLSVIKALGADSVILVGVDLGLSEECLYASTIGDLEHTEDMERRKDSFEDEKKTFEEIIPKVGIKVYTVSTAVEGMEKIESIPKGAKFSLPLKRYSRHYWHRLKKLAKEMSDSIDAIYTKRKMNFESDFKNAAIFTYLLYHYLDTAIARSLVTNELDLDPILATMKQVQPLLKRITLSD